MELTIFIYHVANEFLSMVCHSNILSSTNESLNLKKMHKEDTFGSIYVTLIATDVEIIHVIKIKVKCKYIS